MQSAFHSQGKSPLAALLSLGAAIASSKRQHRLPTGGGMFRTTTQRIRGKFWREGSDREELRAYRRQQGGPGLEPVFSDTGRQIGWQPRGGFPT